MNNLTGSDIIIIVTVGSATITELNQVLTSILYGFVVILNRRSHAPVGNCNCELHRLINETAKNVVFEVESALLER